MSRPLHSSRTTLGVLSSTVFERQSLILAIVSIALALVTYLVSNNQLAPAWLIYVSAIIEVSIVWVLIAALRKLVSESEVVLPSLLAVVPNPANPSLPILLLQPNDLFGTSTVVSIYHRDNDTGYEALIGHGTVLTIQGDRKIQVQIEEWLEGNDSIIERVRNQNATILPQVIVRPYSAGLQYLRIRDPQRSIDVTAIQAYLLQEWAKLSPPSKDSAND